jgi:hypothetical protein
MSKVLLFPGTTEVSAALEPESDLDTLILQQSDLLGRWWELGTELRRRACDLPIGIRFEIDELLRLTSA